MVVKETIRYIRDATYGYKKGLQILLGDGVRINSAQKCEERETRTYSGPNGESYHVCPGEYRPE